MRASCREEGDIKLLCLSLDADAGGTKGVKQAIKREERERRDVSQVQMQRRFDHESEGRKEQESSGGEERRGGGEQRVVMIS